MRPPLTTHLTDAELRASPVPVTVPVYPIPFDIAVQAGLKPGWRIMDAMGERQSMGTTATGEDVWHGNALVPAATAEIPYPGAAGVQMQLVCENAGDTLAGAGVQKVRIDYILPNGTEAFIDVETTGGAVDIAIPLIRFVQDMYAIQWGAGATKTAIGNIKVWEKATTTNVFNMIKAGGNKSLVPNRMVPAGHIYIPQGWHSTEAKSKRVAYRPRATCTPDGLTLLDGFLFKDDSFIIASAGPEMRLTDCVCALTRMKVTAWPDAVGAEGSVHYWGYLVDVSVL